MAGRPCKTEYDRKQNLKEYMDTLQLQIKNNKTNYDANILYKQTGIPTQPTDTRTYYEKQQDIAELKVLLRAELRTLLDDRVIQEVFHDLNDEQIKFLAGISSKMIADLKPKYKFGMTAHHFVDIFDKYVREEHDFGTMSENLGSLADQLHVIEENMVTPSKIDELIDHIVHSKYTRSDENERVVNYLRTLNQEIIHTQDLMGHLSDGNTTQLEQINNKLLNPDDFEAMISYAGAEHADAVREALIEQFATLPTIEQVDYLIEKIDRANGLGDRNGLDGILQEIRQNFSDTNERIDQYDDDVKESMNQIKQQQQQQEQQAKTSNRGMNVQMQGIYDQLSNVNENVGAVNEKVGAVNERVGTMHEDLTNLAPRIKYELASLYDSLTRNMGQLHGNQGAMNDTINQIAATIQNIPETINISTQQMIDLESQLATITRFLMTNTATVDELNNIKGLLNTLTDAVIRPPRQSQPQTPRQPRNQPYEQPQQGYLNFVPHDEFEAYNVKQTKTYLRGLWETGNPELREALFTTMGIPIAAGAKTFINQFKSADLPGLREDYKQIEELAQSVLSLHPSGEHQPQPPSPVRVENITPAAAAAEEQNEEQEDAGSPLFAPASIGGRGILKEGMPIKHGGISIRMTGRGIAAREKYVPFGRYLINIHKLEHNNTVSFKSTSNKSTNIASKRISQTLADVLLHIVNGTAHEIQTDNLTEDEIEYMYHLIKKCELHNFLDGKAENKLKTKTEQEIHRFQLLQGEIVAGNNNPSLVREFKTILLTMMNEGKLPKREAGDVLI